MAAKSAASQDGGKGSPPLSNRVRGSLLLGLEDEDRAGVDADADLGPERRRVALLDARQKRRVDQGAPAPACFQELKHEADLRS